MQHTVNNATKKFLFVRNAIRYRVRKNNTGRNEYFSAMLIKTKGDNIRQAVFSQKPPVERFNLRIGDEIKNKRYILKLPDFPDRISCFLYVARVYCVLFL